MFHYLFDFGDDWWHRIRVESVLEAPAKRKYIKMVICGPCPTKNHDEWDEEEDA